MNPSQKPRSFLAHQDQAWKTLSCGGTMGLMVAQCGGSPAAVALAASLFVLPSLRNVIDAHRERHGDKSPLPQVGRSDRDRRSFADAAAYGWINELKSRLSFEDFVTELADSSNRYGRRFSVTCVKIAGLSKSKTEQVASLLRSHVRATDEIKIVSDDEFLICTPLLRDAVSADVVVKRLETMLSRSDLLDADSELSLGKAVSPRDGYTGPDLIKAARAALRPAASVGTSSVRHDVTAFPQHRTLTPSGELQPA